MCQIIWKAARLATMPCLSYILYVDERCAMSLQKPKARIFSPPRSPMQSGHAGQGEWLLEFSPDARPRLDPVTGWSGGLSTESQVRLRFHTSEQAVAYATAQGLAFSVESKALAKPIKPKVYADNFKYGRVENWTH